MLPRPLSLRRRPQPRLRRRLRWFRPLSRRPLWRRHRQRCNQCGTPIPGDADTLAVVQVMLNDVGVNTTLESLEWSAYNSRIWGADNVENRPAPTASARHTLGFTRERRIRQTDVMAYS